MGSEWTVLTQGSQGKLESGAEAKAVGLKGQWLICLRHWPLQSSDGWHCVPSIAISLGLGVLHPW